MLAKSREHGRDGQTLRDYTDNVIDGWARLSARPELPAYGTGVRLLRMGRLVERAIDAAATAEGLGVSGDYEVLATLRRSHPEPLQPATLAANTMITTSGMTGRLDRLESEGLIARRHSQADRRAIDIHLTPLGIDVADRVFDTIITKVSDMLSAAPEKDVQRLSNVLRAVLVSLGDLTPE